ncbi:GNAT family N-acetyltransferase [Paenibacillus humicola]|uniref:GNAT family N-acetyltransferase n=1 Tax=Paenibacillus humicola TaxID=3110540 RepID=UPI00237B128F|nr:GNAT family N-acetyltransferase [Paenibacillus humicola]
MHASDIFERFPVLNTDRLILRKLEPSDAEALYEYYSDADVTRYMDWYGPESVEQAKDMIVSWNDMYRNRQLLPWGLTLNGRDRLIGTVMYMPIRGTFEQRPLYPVTVGYDLDKAYWNRGMMTEALKAVIDFGLERFGAHRIQAEVAPKNKASLKLLEKLGFKREGVLHQYLMHEATKMFLDVVMLALLNN